MAENGPRAGAGHFADRVLVPGLARPIRALTLGRLGTWNETAFAMLLVNSLFCATGVAAVGAIASIVLPEMGGAGLVAPLAYLLNFSVSNYGLSGMVDSADSCFFALLIWALLRRAYWAIPFIGLLGATAKETFVPIATAIVFTWAFFEHADRRPILGAGAAMAGASLAAVLAIKSWLAGSVVTPWKMIADEQSPGFAANALEMARSWNVWVTFAWAPFAFMARLELPSAWKIATLTGCACVVVLGIWNGSGPNIARPLFSLIGPLCAVGFARFASKPSAHPAPSR